MRRALLLLGLLALGCSGSPAAPSDQPAPQADELPPDLGTRTAGSDWPGFLGPLGTGVSAEKGILTAWPHGNLRLVWKAETGTGYGMPSVSRGRLFLFDRHGNQARLRCL